MTLNLCLQCGECIWFVALLRIIDLGFLESTLLQYFYVKQTVVYLLLQKDQKEPAGNLGVFLYCFVVIKGLVTFYIGWKVVNAGLSFLVGTIQEWPSILSFLTPSLHIHTCPSTEISPLNFNELLTFAYICLVPYLLLLNFLISGNVKIKWSHFIHVTPLKVF